MIGHSNGGDAAQKIAKRKFPREGWDVELLVTVDPVGKPIHNYKAVRIAGSRTLDWINYYQRDDTASFSIPFWPGPEFRLQGYQLVGGENRNDPREFPASFSGPHLWIAEDPYVTKDISQRIRSK